MLDNDDLFHSIFEIKPYELKLGNFGRRKRKVDSITYYSINPIINNCLRYALNHLEKYKHRAIDLLKFGINHNRRIASEIAFDEYYICDELGGLKSFRDEDCYDIIIFVDVEVKDAEVKAFIKQLPKFKARS